MALFMHNEWMMKSLNEEEEEEGGGGMANTCVTPIH